MPSGLNGLLELSMLLESVTLMVIGHYRKGIQTKIRQDESRRPGKVLSPSPLRSQNTLPPRQQRADASPGRAHESSCAKFTVAPLCRCGWLIHYMVDWLFTWLTDLITWLIFFFKFPGWPISHDLKLSPYINIVDLSCVASPPLGLEGVASSTLNKDISVTYDVDDFPWPFVWWL